MSSNVKTSGLSHIHTCMRSHIESSRLHTEGVKDTTQTTLRERISHTHTHIQQENTRREAIRRGITAAANVLTSACLSWQPSVSFLVSWDLHVSMCECVHMCLVEIRAADERSEHKTNSECCFSLLCVRKPSYNRSVDWHCGRMDSQILEMRLILRFAACLLWKLFLLQY